MQIDIVNNKFVRRYFTESLENGLFGAGFLNLCSLPKDFSFSPQPFYSFSLVLSGSLTFTDAAGSLYKLKTGDVFQLLPHQSCDISCPNETKIILYHVCFGNLTFQALLAAGLLNPAPVFSIPVLPHLESWMPVLVQQLTDTPQNELSEVYLNLQKFSIHLHRQGRLNPAQEHTLLIESAKQLLFDACLTPKVSFHAVADALGISYETFRKLFKEEAGQSPLQYVLEHKFHYAQRFLTEGKSVKETAAAVGYNDPYVFSKQFKKYMGAPPSHFLQKN